MMKQSYALGSVPSRTATGHKTTMGRLLLMTLTLLLAMFAPSAMYAQQVQLTVNEGESTDNFVPIYGYYADAITKSQFIIPATELSTMVYGTIDKLTLLRLLLTGVLLSLRFIWLKPMKPPCRLWLTMAQWKR